MLTKVDLHKQLFFGACFVVLPSLLFSQNKIIDSLSLLLQHAGQDTTKINLNYKLAEQLADYDVTRSDYHLEEGYKLSKIGNKKYHVANNLHD